MGSQLAEGLEAVPTNEADAVFNDPQAAVQLEEETGSLEPIAAESVITAGIDNPEEGKAILDRIKEKDLVMAEFEHNVYWPLAEDLYEVQKKNYFKLLNYDKFDVYLDRELKMGRGHGYHMAKIYGYFSVTLKNILADKPDLYSQFVGDVKKMGWTKALKICESKAITSDNAYEVIPQIVERTDDGKYLSVREIAKLCKSEKEKLEDDTEKLEEADGGEESNAPTMKSFSVKLTLSAYNDVIKAIDKEKQISGDKKEASLLRSICIKFLAENSGDANIQSVLSHYERNTELDFVAIDRNTGEVVYGVDNMASLIKEPTG